VECAKFLKIGNLPRHPVKRVVEMLSSLRKYAQADQVAGQGNNTLANLNYVEPKAQRTHPIVWKGNTDEYRSLLVVREAELILAEAQLTGSDKADWWVYNRIINLESQIADLRRWLAEERGK
jgi:hypothetical protein